MARRTSDVFQGRKDLFQMTFPNNWTISIGYGSHHYCDGSSSWVDDPSIVKASTCEVAVFNPEQNFVRGWPHCSGHDDVQGHLTPEDVLDIIDWIRNQD